MKILGLIALYLVCVWASWSWRVWAHNEHGFQIDNMGFEVWFGGLVACVLIVGFYYVMSEEPACHN
jgi:hypothetical protein